MRKRTFIITISIILLIGISSGLYYFNTFILPKIVKEKIISGISGFTSGKVNIGEVRFNLLRGIVISDLIIYEKDSPENILSEAKEISSSFLIIPFFKQRQIVLPSLKIKSLRFYLTRNTENTFNISYLIEKLKTAPSAQGKIPFFPLLVKNMEVTDASVLFKDQACKPPADITLKLLHLRIGASWNKAVFEAFAQVTKDKKNTDLTIHGFYDFWQKHLKMNFQIKQLDFKTYEEYLRSLPLSINSGQIPELEAALILNNKNLKLEATLGLQSLNLKKDELSLTDTALDTKFSVQAPLENFNQISYQGRINIQNGFFSYKDKESAEAKIEKSSIDFEGNKEKVQFKGDFTVSGFHGEKDNLRVSNAAFEAQFLASIPLITKDNLNFSYEGTAKIKNADVAGIETINVIKNIVSNIKFKNKEITIENLQAQVLETPVTAQGTLKQNMLNVDLVGTFTIEKLLPLVEQKLNLPSFELAGLSTIKAHCVADITSKELPGIFGEAQLAQIKFGLPEYKLNLAAESGSVSFDIKKESLRWNFGAVTYQKQNYQFSGKLDGFTKPLIHARIAGPDIRIETDFSEEKNIFSITALECQLKNSTFNLHGKINPKENLNIVSNFIFDLVDLKGLLPQNKDIKDILEQIKPQGRCFINADISGPIQDYRLWRVKATGKSKTIKLYGFSVTNVALDYNQIDQKGFLNNLSFATYKGQGVVKGDFDLSQKKIPLLLNGVFKDIDLNELKNDTTMKNKTFYGILGLNISISGVANDVKSLKGESSLVIKNGNLLEFNPLKGLVSFFFIPHFGNIVFTHAQGDFTISDGFIKTDNLELLGPELGLIAEGKMSFSGDLDFLVNAQAIQPGQKETAGEQAGIIGKTTEVVAKAGSLTGIKISGTINKPKYKIQPIAENIIKKVGDILSNLVP